MRYLALLSIVLVSVAGCSESDTESLNTPAVDVTLTPVNQLCPIMGSAVTEDGGTVGFEGKLVGFCCPSCDGKWNKLSATDKAAKLASADEAHGGHEHGDHEHGDHEHGDHDHGDHDHGDHDHGDHDHGDHDPADKDHEHDDADKDVEKKDAEKDAASDE
jgi:hypothetical protein